MGLLITLTILALAHSIALMPLAASSSTTSWSTAKRGVRASGTQSPTNAGKYDKRSRSQLISRRSLQLPVNAVASHPAGHTDNSTASATTTAHADSSVHAMAAHDRQKATAPATRAVGTAAQSSSKGTQYPSRSHFLPARDAITDDTNASSSDISAAVPDPRSAAAVAAGITASTQDAVKQLPFERRGAFDDWADLLDATISPRRAIVSILPSDAHLAAVLTLAYSLRMSGNALPLVLFHMAHNSPSVAVRKAISKAGWDLRPLERVEPFSRDVADRYKDACAFSDSALVSMSAAQPLQHGTLMHIQWICSVDLCLSPWSEA